MTTKTMLAALLALPLFVMGCNKPPSAATSAADNPDKQAATSTPDKAMNSAPPAAGMPSNSGTPSASSMEPSVPANTAPVPADTSGNQQGGSSKSSY